MSNDEVTVVPLGGGGNRPKSETEREPAAVELGFKPKEDVPKTQAAFFARILRDITIHLQGAEHLISRAEERIERIRGKKTATPASPTEVQATSGSPSGQTETNEKSQLTSTGVKNPKEKDHE